MDKLCGCYEEIVCDNHNPKVGGSSPSLATKFSRP
jgi:hypothetical protein